MTKTTRHAAAVSAALCGLFVLVYSTCNWLTSFRPNVGSLFFPWERRIPFVPALIIPYMSIDLFFIAAPFLLRSPKEIRTFTLRVATAILVAGICFLMFPLKFAFERPHVEGVLGFIFNNFRNLDLPYNEFPSLHITLWCLLLDVYLRYTRGAIRALIAIWFSLIAASTALTFQHHLPDILGGFALATLCFYFIRDEPFRQRFVPNPRIAIYYFILAITLAALAFVFPPFTWLLLWPGFTALLLAAAYLFLGPGVYRKHQGQVPWSARVLLWPALLGQYISLFHYSRQCRAHDRLTKELLIGRRLKSAEARAAGVVAVIDLTAEFTESRPFRRLPYLSLRTLDLTAPTAGQIDQALAFIQHHAPIGTVYLHCKIGYSRTAVIAGAYLMASGAAATRDEAIAILRRARPQIIIRPEALRALEIFFQRPTSPKLADQGATAFARAGSSLNIK